MNWVICYRAAQDGARPPAREDRNRRGSLEELLPHVRAFNTDVIDLEALVAATPEFVEYPICDRDPCPSGPMGARDLAGRCGASDVSGGFKGASQAILDARELTDLSVQSGDVPSAPAAYEASRLPATAQVVALNRKGRTEGVIGQVQRRAPDGFADLDPVITPEECHMIVRGHAATAGFSQDQRGLRRA